MTHTNEEFTGELLDRTVAQYQGLPIKKDPMAFKTGSQSGYWVWSEDHASKIKYQLIGHDYSPSTLWQQGGSIIEQYGIALRPEGNAWVASYKDIEVYGKTPLIAAMRCYVMLSGSIENK